MGLKNRMLCCGAIPIDDFMDVIDRDCNSFTPPGMRRESRDEQHASDRQLSKTAGNALHEAQPLVCPQTPQRVSVIVPGGVSSGETMYVQYLDGNQMPRTLAANVPPNAYAGMQFFVEVPKLPEKAEEKIQQTQPEKLI